LTSLCLGHTNVSFELKQLALDQAWWNLKMAARTKLEQPRRSTLASGSDEVVA